MAARIPLAWMQLKRERVRFAVGVAGVTFAVTLIFMQLGFNDALFTSAVRLHNSMKGDLFLLNPRTNYLVKMEPFARSRLYQAGGHPEVERVTPVYAQLAVWKNPWTAGTRPIFVVAFDPAADLLDIAGVPEQRDLVRQRDVVLYDAASRPEFGPVAEALRRGEQVVTELNNREITAVGLFTLGTSFGVDGSVVTSDVNFVRLFPFRGPHLIDLGVVKLRSGADPEAVRRDLAATLPRDVDVLTKAAYMEREQDFWGKTTPIGYVFTFGVIMGLVVGAIIVYQILFADISGHLAEYATLKAMGYRNRYLFGVVFQEAIILALVGYIPGFLICLQLYRVTESATRLPMVMRVDIGLLVLALTVAMCCISGAIALRKIRSADPAEIF